MKKITRRFYNAVILFCLAITVANCSTARINHSTALPQGLVGLNPGMTREAAEQHLREIGEFVRDENKNQQLWRLRDDPNFSQLAVGFDREDRIRYITAFAEKEKASKLIRFTEVGNIENAKAEIVAPHYRYTWDVPAAGEMPSYIVTIYGDNPNFVTMYSIAGKVSADDEEEEERERELSRF